MDLAGLQQLLHVLVHVHKVNALHALAGGLVDGVWPVHQVQVDVVQLQLAQGVQQRLLDFLVVVHGQLCGHEDLLSGNAGILDALADLGLVLVERSRVNVSVAVLKSNFAGVGGVTGVG